MGNTLTLQELKKAYFWLSDIRYVVSEHAPAKTAMLLPYRMLVVSKDVDKAIGVTGDLAKLAETMSDIEVLVVKGWDKPIDLFNTEWLRAKQ